ncbi:histidine phosphatase family protein [Dellaglioa sp. L3N]
MSFTVYMVRHGQTLFNSFQRMQGWCDSPLTDKGINDATHAGQLLQDHSFDAIYRSDTIRTEKTLDTILKESHIAQNAQLIPVETALFREEYYGFFEGQDTEEVMETVGAPYNCQTFLEILENYSIEDSRDFIKKADPFSLAEDNQEFWNRYDQAFDFLRARQNDNDQVLLVGHGTAIRSIVSRYAPDIDILTSPKNGSVTKLIIHPDTIEVSYYGNLGEQPI